MDPCWQENFQQRHQGLKASETGRPKLDRASLNVPRFLALSLKGWSAGSVPWNQIRGYVTYGARTMPENLSGRADYQGQVQAEFRNADDPSWNTQINLLGTLHLEANLHDGEISGRIDELLTRPPGVARYQPLADGNVIDIASARELRASCEPPPIPIWRVRWSRW